MSTGQDSHEVFLDARGNGRALRLSWHHDDDVVVLSLWREGVCAGTFRLPKSQVNDFIDALVDGLRDTETPPVAPAEPEPSFMSWAFGDMPERHATAG
jgi:hypothetical protein